MLQIEVPTYKILQLEHLVLDYNGTLACDGALCVGARGRLDDLGKQLQIHVVTADTFGKARAALEGIQCEILVLESAQQADSKLAYVEKLGFDKCVCIGNGRNDRLMLKATTLGIAVIGREGVAIETLLAADIAVPDIVAALDLLRNPLRLVATLRD